MIRGIRVVSCALACVVAVGCGSKGESARGAVGGAAAAAITAGLTATAHERAPWRCAALDPPPPAGGAITLATTTWTVDGRVARRTPAAGPGPVRIAFVADAEAATPATLAVVQGLRAKLAGLKVDLVVSLGGMGASQDDLTQVLGALADGAIAVVAIPGDREPAAGHRAAVAGLAARGVLDGSLVRWIVVGGVGIATLPGQPFAARLAHGVEGCGHIDADVAAVIGAAPDGVAVKILAGQRAPRHADGADRAALGVPAGDPGVAVQGVDAVVHGALDGTPARAGTRPPGDAPVAIATGIATASPRLDSAGRRVTPAIIVITVEGNRVAWQPITP